MEDNNKTAVQVAEEKHLKRGKIIEDLKRLYTHLDYWEKATKINHVIVIGTQGRGEQTIIPGEHFEVVRVLSVHTIKKEIAAAETELINL